MEKASLHFSNLNEMSIKAKKKAENVKFPGMTSSQVNPHTV